MDEKIIRNLHSSYDSDTEVELRFAVALEARNQPTVKLYSGKKMVGSSGPPPPGGAPKDWTTVSVNPRVGVKHVYDVTCKMPPQGAYRFEVVGDDEKTEKSQSFLVYSSVTPKDLPGIIAAYEGVPTSLVRGAAPQVTDDEWIWVRILASAEAFSYDEYKKFVDKELRDENSPPRSSVRSYKLLATATENFMQTRCTDDGLEPYINNATGEARNRLARSGKDKDKDEIENLKEVAQRLKVPKEPEEAYRKVYLQGRERFYGLCAVELIWSYWLEEAMLVQTMKAISRRFQNRRSPHGIDPLANFETDPLRPLNNFLWGYVEDEQHRLSVVRRAHEYEHHYGLPMKGLAVADVRPADRRSKFIESFHNLLYRCVHFYRQLDDLTVRPDGFPVLNAVKETHYLIAQGAHNQFGDLPEVARREMLMEQWLLGRTETRDFLRARDMVPYPEDWMDRVDAMKNIQGWIDTSVVHFNDLAKFGEKILLSIRYGSWASQNNPDAANTWARFFRQEIQGYIHGYRAVTGVDLASEVSHPRQTLERYSPPSEHLQRRLAAQSTGAR